MTNGLHGDVKRAFVVQDLLEANGELYTVSDVESVGRQNRSNYLLQLEEEGILTLKDDGDTNVYSFDEELAIEEYGDLIESIGVDWE